MDKNDLKSVLSSALNLVRTVMDWIKKRLKLSSAKTELVAAQMEEEKKQIDRANLWNDYNNVANAVGDCLVMHHGQCGLCRPKMMVDLYCNDSRMRIDPGPPIVFSYEVDRMVSDLYLGGMKKYEFPRVPKEDIQKKLSLVMPKYVNNRGYGYAILDVTDHQEDSIIITLSGVGYL